MVSPENGSPAPDTFARFLEGKTALVTGASRGIGAATSVALARAGANLIGVARTTQSMDATADEVRGLGGEFIPIAAQLDDRDDVYRVCSQVTSTGSVPDILVLAAGINRRAPIAEHADELWDEVLAVNLDAPFILAREVGRRMVERGSGKIVFFASLLSYQGGITVPGYAASKGAVVPLVRAFSNEWSARGVNVNAVAPGYVLTDMNEALVADAAREQQILQRIPAGRWARPDDIAGAVLFLVSPAADYVHGTVIPVDGGWLGR